MIVEKYFKIKMIKIMKKLILLLTLFILINFPVYGMPDFPERNYKYENLYDSGLNDGGYTEYVLIDGKWWAFEYDEAGNLIKVYMVSDPGV
jgi:hypothetical protein